MSAAQVGYGLYGALLVEDPADGVGVADEITLVLSDIGFDRRGVLEPADSGGSAGMVFGREGSYVLVNGRTPADAARPRRRAAALAHRQRRQEPLLLPRSGRPAVHGDRPGRRAAGAAGRPPTSCSSRRASAWT